MKRESISYVIIAALLILAAGCTDGGITGPEEEAPPIVYAGLEITYTADPGSAESGEVTPEAGGTVSATGPNGVSYELVMSPGAIGSNTTITITPLSKLTIWIEDSSVIDTSECLTGALFEPEGLEFDSTAVLTITYPPGGIDCQLSGAFCIVHIDSAESFYEIIPTTYIARSHTSAATERTIPTTIS